MSVRAELKSSRVVDIGPDGLRAATDLTSRAPSLTCLEELALFGQISQVAVYAAKHVSRRQVPNLWLRSFTLERSGSSPSSTVASRTMITRDRILRIAGQEVVDLQLTSETDYGATARASFAYRL